MSDNVPFSKPFPEEILVEFFKRLPVKSLGSCMCVCKAWKSLIKNPYLISAHLENSNNSKICCSRSSDKNMFLLVTCLPGPEGLVDYSLHLDDQEFSKYTQLEFPPFDVYHYVVGSCNGLICLIDFESGSSFIFSICNPVIKKCIRLPKPNLPDLTYEYCTGFGFDSTTNDYKVLKITRNNILDKLTHVELYSLKRNSWKTLAPPEYQFYSSDSMVFVNGVVHWIACESPDGFSSFSRKKVLLMGFDLGEEAYKEILLPEDLSINLEPRSELFVVPYDELSSIAMAQSKHLSGECDIWVMRAYGVEETWTKMFTFVRTGIEELPRVLQFRSNGVSLIVLRLTADEEVVSPQLEGNGSNRNVQVRGIYGFAFSFVESLVLLLDQQIDAGNGSGTENGAGSSN